MNSFQVRNPNFDSLVRASFARQQMMKSLGAQLLRVEPGQVTIELPFDARWSQQHGFTHAGAITSVVDSACGYAALTLMPPGYDVLTIEYKVNFLNPAQGQTFVAVGQVVKSGRTVTVCQGQVYATKGDRHSDIAVMQASMIALADQPMLK
ncbi:MAG: PaaI family thioesterase [Pirellulaceae bacterium]|nr:PaaI family thioesterase [Pirellulaceae bacterium]